MLELPAEELIAGHRRAAAIEREVVRRVFRPPARLNIAEWSEQFRYLAKEASPGAPGKYSFLRAPYQREPMEVMSDPRVSRVVLMWASQLGKSLVIENAIGHGIDMRPRPMLMVQPKIDSAEGWSKERFAPMVRATPVLRRKVRDPKSRDSENTLRMKMFPGGFLAIASSNSPAELAARAVARVFADETDRYEESAGTEGDPIDLAERRMGTVDDRLLVLVSTPGNKGESRIEPAYEAGDQRKYFVPCPHCKTLLDLQFGSPTEAFGLKWDKGKPDTAQYLCEHCACLIDERHKYQMLLNGRWIAQAPDHPYPSFHLNALYSPFGGTTWPIVVEKFLETKGVPQRLKTFVNTFLAETWEDKGERVDAHTLVPRLGLHFSEKVEIPDGVVALTAGVDVQASYIELWVWGWGHELESAPVFWEQIAGDPGTRRPWAILDELRRKTFTNAAGQQFRIVAGFVDSGGHNTQDVYNYCRPRQRERWFACKGSSEGEGIALVGKPTFQSTSKVMLYSVGVFTAKESFLRSQLHVQEPGPGYVNLPNWLTLEHLEQMTSEKLVTRVVKGRRHREWIKIRDRNEALDCRNYAFGALMSLPLRWLQKYGIVTRPKGKPREDKGEGGDDAPPSAPTEPTPPDGPAPPPDAKKAPRRRGRPSWVRNY